MDANNDSRAHAQPAEAKVEDPLVKIEPQVFPPIVEL